VSNTIKERAVMAAFDEGKPIQGRQRGRGKLVPDWRDSNRPRWNWAFFEYRIKPEPLTFWVNIYSEGDYGRPRDTEEEARKASGCMGGRTVKMQEVIE